MLKVIEETDKFSSLKGSSPSKISKKPKLAFSLPAGSDFSCAGETSICKDACYAKKGRHVFANVQSLQAANWKLLKQMEASADSAGAIKAISDIIPKNAKIYRIHESGDFFSQWYIDVWEKVIKSRADVQFWFYTRCFQFNWENISKLPNVSCWASTDSENLVAATKFVENNPAFRFAFGPLNPSDKPDNTVICPVTSGKLAVDGACEKCMLCVNMQKFTKNIGFVEH